MPALQLAHVASVCALTALEKVPEGHGAVKLAAQYPPACARWEEGEEMEEEEEGRVLGQGRERRKRGQVR